ARCAAEPESRLLKLGPGSAEQREERCTAAGTRCNVMRYNTGRTQAETDRMATEIKKVGEVTGAACGIGLAVAKKFLAEGWRVALLDIEGELLRGATAGLASPDSTMELHCDVSDASGVKDAIAKVGTRF